MNTALNQQIALVVLVIISSILFVCMVIKDLSNFKTFRYFLWRIGLRKSCPYCGGEIVDAGYARDFVQYYKCLNRKCKFGKEKK